MKKLLVVLFMAAALTACGGSEEVAPTDTTVAEEFSEPEFEAEATKIDSYTYDDRFYPVHAFCDNRNRVYVGSDNIVVIENEIECRKLFNE